MEYEEVFRFLYDLSERASFDIKSTEAQHYRRYVAQRRKAKGRSGTRIGAPPDIIQRQAGINDGKGFMFISHVGEIYPSGFLPLSAANLRRDSLVDVYRSSPWFRALRKADNLHGKCGECGYRNLCGGSRSRSYALTGDFLAEDPTCIYQPVKHGRQDRIAAVCADGGLTHVAGDTARLVQLR